MTSNPRGIITVLNTPFAEDDAVDLPGLQRNVEGALEAGVAGFLVPAMASETDYLTAGEKRSIVKLVVDRSQGRAVVIGGASANAQAERLRLSKTYLDLGCDGVLVQLTADTGVQLLEQNLQELSELEPDILMLQDWDNEGTGIPLPTILHLFETVARFNWLKVEVQNAGPKYSHVLQATNGQLNVAGGWAVTQMIDGLDRGVHAFMPTGMHRIYVEICRRYSQGDRAAAITLFDQIRPVLAFSNQTLDTSILFFKRLLFMQNVYSTPNVRATGAQFGAAERQAADELIQSVTDTERHLTLTN